MKITILSIGKFDNANFKELFNNYLKRIGWKVNLIEIESKISNAVDKNKTMEIEGDLLIKNFDKYQKIIILDPLGQELDSVKFSNIIKKFSIEGFSNIAFVIGGAYGLSEKVKGRGDLILSLSQMTMPHLMVRLFMIEQLYRSYSIINNHPYHK